MFIVRNVNGCYAVCVFRQRVMVEASGLLALARRALCAPCHVERLSLRLLFQ